MFKGWELPQRWSMALRASFIIVVVSLRFWGRPNVQTALRFIYCHFFPPPPGYSIALLAFLGLIMALTIGENPGRYKKAAWIFVGFALMALEMWAISHDRAAQDAKYASDRAAQEKAFHESETKLASIFQETKGMRSDVKKFQLQAFAQSNEIAKKQEALAVEVEERLKAAAAVPEKTAPPPANPPLPSLNNPVLKAQALQLAKDITDWLVSISADAPPQFSSQSQQFLERLNSEWRDKWSASAGSTLTQLQLLKVAPVNIHACMPNLPVSDTLMMLNFRKMCAADIENGAAQLK
jgi:hypothetical protein